MKRVRAGRAICGANEFATDGGKRSFKEPALRWSVAVGGDRTKGASTVARRRGFGERRRPPGRRISGDGFLPANFMRMKPRFCGGFARHEKT